ncbi:hypothetical protein D3C81_1466270 [compost metagenome]
MHNVEDAVRQAGLFEQFGNEQARARVDRAGLEHEGVTGRQCHREHPHRHHDREVERCDTCHYAERLAQRPVVDIGTDLIGEVGLEQLWRAAGELDDLDAAHHFALGVGKHLAVFGGDQPGQVVTVFVEQRQEFVEYS